MPNTAEAVTTAPVSSTTKKVISPEQDKLGRAIIKTCTTKSSQIRALAAKKWERGDIARFLSIVHGKEVRYQHVRNVLVTPVSNPTK